MNNAEEQLKDLIRNKPTKGCIYCITHCTEICQAKGQKSQENTEKNITTPA